jgi:hypothetical protein
VACCWQPEGSRANAATDRTFLRGEYPANMIPCRGMARRHTPTPQLTDAELAELRAKLDAMPQNALEIYYKATHDSCRFVMRVPSAKLMQELVTVWKALRKRISETKHNF